MKRILSTVIAVLALTAASAAAQDKPAPDKPNFVGAWKLTDPAQPDQFTASKATSMSQEQQCPVSHQP